MATAGDRLASIKGMRVLAFLCALCAACTAATPTPTPTISESPTPISQRTGAPSPSPAAQRFRIDAVAGTLERRPASLSEGDGGPATSAHLAQMTALAVAKNGDVYLAESILGTRPGQVQTVVRRVDRTTGLISTVVGPKGLGYVNALGFTPAGELLIGGNYSAAAIWRLRDGRLEPFAGTARGGERGDGGPALDAAIFNVNGLGYDVHGNLHLADWNDGGRIRRIMPDGTIEGYGTAPPVPFGFTLDGAGNGYVGSNSVAGTYLYRIAPNGAATIVAGSSGRFGFSGDGGPSLAARFASITALAFGPDGSMYLVDTGNYRIRRIDPSGIVTTIAGTGRPGYTGDGGPALDADLDEVRWLAAGTDGSLYLGTYSPSTVRKLTPVP